MLYREPKCTCSYKNDVRIDSDYFTMTKGLGDFPLLAIFTDFRLRDFCKKVAADVRGQLQ